MRQKRAKEAKGERTVEAQVEVLMNEDARLETTVQRMRQEVVALRQLLGMTEPTGQHHSGGGAGGGGFNPALLRNTEL
jgi:hypothetical protein